MYLLHSRRYLAFALAFAALTAGTVLAGGAPATGGDTKGELKKQMFVKEGDKYRPANESELKLAAGVSHGHADDHGKDKVGFAGIRYDLGIYTLIVFGILMFILAKYAWP